MPHAHIHLMQASHFHPLGSGDCHRPPPPRQLSPVFPVTTTWRATFDAVQPHLGNPALNDAANEAVLDMLRYLFFRGRAAVFVAIRRGKVAAFVPFANMAYRNTWGKHAVLCDAHGNALPDVAAYAAAKAKQSAIHAPKHGATPEPMLPLDCWWTNGSVVCNVMPDGGWGQGFLPQLHDMLTAAVASGVPAATNACFFLNKRDYPLVKINGADASAAFTGSFAALGASSAAFASASVPVPVPVPVPVFSWYVGSNFRDVAMPVVDDWTCDDDAWSALRAGVSFAARPPVAVFRGAATGPLCFDKNPRIRAARAATSSARAAADAAASVTLDVGITGLNATRDRVTLNAAGRPQVQFATALFPLVRYETLQDQACRARFLVYIDGHCAASRYGTLMRTGCVILRVQSEQAAECGDTWIFQNANLRGVGKPQEKGLLDADELAAADHILVPSAEDLPAVAAWAAALPLHVLETIAANAVTRRPTRHKITEWWANTITALAARQKRHCDVGSSFAMTDEPPVAWFTQRDFRYADLAAV